MSICVVYILTSEEGNNIGKKLRQDILQQCEYLPITINCIRFHRDNDINAGNIGLDSLKGILESRLSLAKQVGASLGEIYWVFLFTPDVKLACKNQHAATSFLTNLSYIYAFCREKTGSTPRFFFFYPTLPEKYTYSPGLDTLKKISQQIIRYDCSICSEESMDICFDKAGRDFVDGIYAAWNSEFRVENEQSRKLYREILSVFSYPDAKIDPISMLWARYYATKDQHEREELLGIINHLINPDK